MTAMAYPHSGAVPPRGRSGAPGWVTTAATATAPAGRVAGPGFGPGFGPPFGPRGRRAARGDVRAAVLLLLAEEPRNGYALMQEIEERSEGVWRPSPGSIYPALAQLEDEGLVEATKEGSGRVFALTDAGREHVESRREELGEPWKAVSGGFPKEAGELRDLDDAGRRGGDAGRPGRHRRAAQARGRAPDRGAPRALPHPLRGRARRAVADHGRGAVRPPRRCIGCRHDGKRRVLVVLDRLPHLRRATAGCRVVPGARGGARGPVRRRIRAAGGVAARRRPRAVAARRGRRTVVELGTATGWTTASLVLADPARAVTSYDPVVLPGRARYAALVPRRPRADDVRAGRRRGRRARWDGAPVDLLFIDSTHTREDTIAEFRAWRANLAPAASSCSTTSTTPHSRASPKPSRSSTCAAGSSVVTWQVVRYETASVKP